MELALNLVWLAVSGMALAWWIRQVRKQALGGAELLRGLVLLTCVLALFFPVISASDDLHANVPAVEDAFSYARKMKAGLQGGALAAPVVHLPLAFLLILMPALLLPARFSGLRETYEPRATSVLLRHARLGRSPPTGSFC